MDRLQPVIKSKKNFGKTIYKLNFANYNYFCSDLYDYCEITKYNIK